ncbi:glutathione S-transferase theta-1-like [Xiphophorus maculatus]|uniref:glutathione S-transferase theta-1-like n=1 Tax=Xiphophorus maculatus TaxID=8083 RepID=UPI000C6EB478|nr:glutathione S-transferase theta-1-like [Xiphophorus maculatus]
MLDHGEVKGQRGDPRGGGALAGLDNRCSSEAPCSSVWTCCPRRAAAASLRKSRTSSGWWICWQPLGVGVDPFQGRPELTAWRERVKKELGVKLFDQAHEALLNSSGLQQKMQTNNTELQKLKPMFLKYFR